MGITSSNDDLYVALKHSPDIDVFDIDTLVRRRQISVEGLNWACDIVVHANVLYVSEVENELIHRIQLPDEIHSNWTVNSRYLTMSINKEGNVWVTCWDLNKIIEYTPIGTRVCGIKVHAINGVDACLQHAIQLDHDRFSDLPHFTKRSSCLFDRQLWKTRAKLRWRIRIKVRTNERSCIYGSRSEWFHSDSGLQQSPHNTTDTIA